jgi:hypothetical protein
MAPPCNVRIKRLGSFFSGVQLFLSCSLPQHRTSRRVNHGRIKTTLFNICRPFDQTSVTNTKIQNCVRFQFFVLVSMLPITRKYTVLYNTGRILSLFLCQQVKMAGADDFVSDLNHVDPHLCFQCADVAFMLDIEGQWFVLVGQINRPDCLLRFLLPGGIQQDDDEKPLDTVVRESHDEIFAAMKFEIEAVRELIVKRSTLRVKNKQWLMAEEEIKRGHIPDRHTLINPTFIVFLNDQNQDHADFLDWPRRFAQGVQVLTACVFVCATFVRCDRRAQN